MITHKTLKRVLSLGLAFSLYSGSCVYAETIGTITGEDVNIRATQSTDAVILSTADNGETVTVVADLDGWFRISAPNVGTAYVTSQFVSIKKADGTVNGSSVNIRTSPSTSGAVIGQANTGDLLSVIGSTGDWYTIDYNGTTAYVHKEYLSGDMLKYLGGTSAAVSNPAGAPSSSATANVYATVKCSGVLNMRAQASTGSDIVVTVPSGYNLSVYDYSNGWVKVSDDSGRIGYVSSDYIELKNGSKPSNVSVASSNSSKGNEVITYAKQFIGTPYVYGGTNLQTGVDCSGFVYAVYQHFGISLNRSSRDQYSNGTSVDKSNLQTGDLVFFNTGGNSAISHVGIYISNGQYIHSTDGKAMGVTISNLSTAYANNTYVGAKRVLK